MDKRLQTEIRERKRTARELETLVRQQAAMARFGHYALTCDDLQGLMDECVRFVADTLEVEMCKILELLPDKSSFLLRAGSGWKEGLVGQTRVGSSLESQAGFTLASDRPVVVVDLREEKRFQGPRLLVDHQVVSGASVIIAGDGQPFGVLGAHTHRLRRFGEGDIQFLSGIANTLAAAIARHRAEEAIRTSEARNRTIVNTVIDGIVVIDETGIVESFNPAAQAIFGYREEETIGQNVRMLMPSPYRDEHQAYLSNYLNSGRPKIIGVGREVEGLRKDGTRFPMQLGVGEMLLEGGRKFVGIVHDLTEFNKLQDDLLRSRSLADLGEMAASVAHEIKNPLAAITGVIEVLQDGQAVSPPYVDVMNQLGERVRHLDNTVKKLLKFARPWKARKQQIDLREMVEHVVGAARDQKEFASVRFRLEGVSPLIADLDLVLIEDVLWNLFYNAADAMPDGGEIRLVLGEDDASAFLDLADDGTGIRQEDIEKVFLPFFTTKSHGTGLGLAICRRIVETHQGTIAVTSSPRKGTQVSISLPKK